MITQETKDVVVGTRVTLDGKPAVINGRLLQFAVVAPLDGGPGVEFSWPTVMRVLASKGGAFSSK